jgi:kynurenine formamidase
VLGAGLPIVENLVGLERLPERPAVAAFPLRVDADGSPARVVAEGDDDGGAGVAGADERP